MSVDRQLLARARARPDSDVDVAVCVRADSDRRWAVERGLQLCARNALDVASHIGSAAGFDPETYGSTIDCLIRANVLPPAFGERFRAVAGFRNVLVHGYLEVDIDLLASILAEHLDDFEQFAGHVERWLADPSNA